MVSVIVSDITCCCCCWWWETYCGACVQSEPVHGRVYSTVRNQRHSTDVCTS